MLKSYLNKIKQFLPLKKYLVVFGGVIILLSIVKLFSYSLSDNLSDSDYQDYFNSNYKTFSVRIPQNINFAGEKVPVADFSVHDAIERELVINTYWQSQSLLLHKRANRWFPVIEPILKKNNIPEDFKYIALIESQLTNAVSPREATGFWQIMECTASQYGLEVSEEVDERYNVIKSTETACRYFKEAYKIFNNWTLVAASYNYGMGGIKGQLDRQKVNNYYDLLLNEETARYVYRILAMKEIIGRPKVYGYMLRKKDLYPVIPTKRLIIDSSISNLADFAIAQNINYKILKLFNPWLRTNTLTNLERKKYSFEIPKNNVKIYDMDGNYDGSNSLTTSDSANLITVSSVKADSLPPNTLTN
ncbi:MAG: lytic transglycosylase domain-containing protein [Bacteroidota bacterium]